MARKLVLTQAHRKIKRGVGVISAGRDNMMHAEFVKRRPIAQRHMGVHQRGLHKISERFFLLGRKLWANVRDHAVVTGEHTILAAHADQLVLANVCDLHILAGCGGLCVLHMHSGAVQSNPHRRVRVVELAVIRSRRNYVIHRLAGHSAGNQCAN